VPDVTVLIADDRLGAIQDVAAALQEAGLRLGQVLSATGVVTGSVDDDAAMERLAAVDGVAAVEPVQEVFIPPPDSPIQ
jgi:enamine deaminase RidA (YjgF/YER057c/UK114 family)